MFLYSTVSASNLHFLPIPTMYLAQISHFSPLKKLGHTRTTKPLNPNMDLIIKSFDETILRGLRSLNPPSVSLTWLSSALRFISSAHAEARTLISNLDVDSSDDSLASYLDGSVKILDLCNSISSVVERLRRRLLRVKVLLNLFSKPDSPKIRRAKDYLSDSSDSEVKTRRFGANLEEVVKDLVLSVVDNDTSARAKISATGRVIRRTICAVGLVTSVLAGVVVSALSGSPEVVKVRVPAEFLWAETLNEMRSTISADIKRRFGGEGKKSYIVEVDDVAGRIRDVSDVIHDIDEDKLGGAVKELGRVTEVLTEGLDGLSNGVNEMFSTVLSIRSGILENLRVGS